MLNQDLTFENIKPQHRASFNGHFARKEKIDKGTLLYKFTDWNVFNEYADEKGNIKESVSPFWGTMSDLHDLLGFADKTGRTLLSCLRQRNAVLHNWNGLNSLLVIRIKKTVQGFVGNIGPQTEKGYAEHFVKRDGYTKPIQVWGGAGQVYLPSLSRNEVEEIVPAETVYVRDPIADILDFLKSIT